MEKYEIKNKRLIIYDEDLDIDINETFDLPYLPKDYMNLKGLTLEKDNGRIKNIYLEKDGVFHGPFISYDDKKNIENECFYYKGLLHGPSCFYAKNKNIIISETFYCFGKKQGKVKRYYLSKQLYCIESYKDNLLHGMQKYYYENGNIKTELFYNMGKLIDKAHLYWPNKKVKRVVCFNTKTDLLYDEKGVLVDDA